MAFYIFETTSPKYTYLYPNCFTQNFETNTTFTQFVQLSPYFQNGITPMNDFFSMSTFQF
jgi:hypothetical protein